MTSELTMNDVFAFLPTDDRISSDTMEALREKLGGVSIAEIGGLKKFEFAGRIKTAEIECDTIQVAGFILDFMRDNEFVSDEPAAAEPSGPIQVEVTLPQNAATMSLRELLELIASDPSRYGEVQLYLEANAQFAAALAKTVNVAIPSDGDGFDVEQTLLYIAALARPHSRVQREWKGQRPVTIEKAIGLEARALIHPFTGEPVAGPDENGFDFGELSDELHRSLIWARTSEHSAWPETVDIFEHGEEVLRDKLPRRWKTILEDYRHAVTNEDPSTLGITRYWTETSKRSDSTMPPPPKERTDEWYQAKLREVAQNPRSGGLGGINAGHEILSSVDGGIGGAHMGGTIVLNAIVGGIGGVKGQVYCTIGLPSRRG